jgi:hypothetical protein
MLNPLDLYDVRGLFTEDERMVQDSVGRFGGATPDAGWGPGAAEHRCATLRT